MKADEYVWIARWGRLMGSSEHYVKDQQKQAASDGAPLTATFRDHETGKWNTVADITNETTLHRLAQMVSADKEGVRIIAEQIASLHPEEKA